MLVSSPPHISRPPFYHQAVLCQFISENILNLSDRLIVDATTGEGGHSLAFLAKTPPTSQLIALDTDAKILAQAKRRLQEKYAKRVTFLHDNFKNIGNCLSRYRGQVDLILFDLGISKFHYFNSQRGFSFAHNEPLDMRLDSHDNEFPSAAQILATYPAKALTTIFRTYGEETLAARYAKAIVAQRKKTPFTQSHHFATFIRQISPPYKKRRRIHPATQVFQALRIYINRELDVLAPGMLGALSLLRAKGRLVVMTYHSLEDRIIKNLFKIFANSNEYNSRYLTPTGGLQSLHGALLPYSHSQSASLPYPPNKPLSALNRQSNVSASNLQQISPFSPASSYQLFNKKVIKPSQNEIKANPAARSAKLRILIKQANH